MNKTIMTLMTSLLFASNAFAFTLRETNSVNSELLKPVAPAMERVASDIGGSISGGFATFKLSNLKAGETLDQVVVRAVKRLFDISVHVQTSSIDFIDNQNPNQVEDSVSELLSADMSLPNREEEIATLTGVLLRAITADTAGSLKIYSTGINGDFDLSAGVLVVVDTAAQEVVIAVQGYGE